jgi:hypothetical protein
VELLEEDYQLRVAALMALAVIGVKLQAILTHQLQ